MVGISRVEVDRFVDNVRSNFARLWQSERRGM